MCGGPQDDIGRRTGTVLTVRGRYYPPGVVRDERDPPLLLHIQPGTSHLEARPKDWERSFPFYVCVLSVF